VGARRAPQLGRDDAHGELEEARMRRGGGLIHVAVALAALVSLTITVEAWRAASAQDEVEVRTRFEFRMAEIVQALRGRLLDYEIVLRGAAALFALSPGVGQSGWEAYVDSLELGSAYTGIGALGYAEYRAGSAARVRLVAPLDERNRRSLGYDMFSEARRRAAMEKARDTATAVATANLVLIQDSDAAQPGFLIYVPVYRGGASPERLAARRAALAGFVYGAFRAGDLARGTLGDTPGIFLQLTDVTDPNERSLLYRSTLQAAPAARYSRTDLLSVNGRSWRLDSSALPSFEGDAGSDRPRLVLVSGLAISALLTGLLWSLLNTRQHARDLARRVLAAREELERFRIAVDQHNDAMLMADADSGRIVYANSGACKALGYSRDELVGAEAKIVFADRDQARIEREYAALADSRSGSSIEEARFRRKDGTDFPVEISRYLMRMSGGGRFVLGVARDITERLAAERSLRHSEERLELSLAASGLALFDWDLKSGLVYLGKEWMTILGGEPAPIVAPIGELEALVHPDDRPALREHIRRLLTGEAPGYRTEHRVRGVDGDWRWIESIAKVTERDAQGRALRVTGTNVDIRERREVAELKNAFIANVSHELRTPLTSIVSSLELLREGAAGELPPQAQQLVQMASLNGDRLVELINDILDLEKTESGRMRLKLQRVEVRAMLEEAAVLNTGYAQRYGVRYRVVPCEASLAVLADPDRLLQILTNFLSNAAKFSPRGGEVVISAAARDDRVLLSVSDSGPGIAPEFRARLFGKFEQADPSRGGSGLGLALCKAMCEKMGGRIGCDSEPGRGARFFVDLPAAPDAKPSEAAPQTG
jgi:PAS domain S-box-containing protein